MSDESISADRRRPRDVRFTPRPVDMMHHGECRIGLATKGRMDVDRFLNVPAPYDDAISITFVTTVSQ